MSPTGDAPDTLVEQEEAHRREFSWIYGLVVCSAVLAVGADLGSAWALASYVLVSLLVYWGAEAYAHLLATRTVLQRRLQRDEVWATLRHGWGLVSASYLPLVVVAAAAVLGAEVATSALLGLVTSTLLLLVAGARAGWVSGLRGWRLVASAALSGLFGLVMIVLKLMLH